MVRKPTSGFKYASDPEAIEKALAEIGGGNFFKPNDGKNIVRILPPYNDSGKFFFKATLYNGFKHNGKYTAIPVDGPAGAYIGKKLNELASEGEEGAKLARRYGARTKYYMNVIDRNSGSVKIWGISEKIMKQLKAFYLDEVDGGELDDPINGRDVIIERSGKGLATQYEIRFRPRQTPALEDGQEVPVLFDLEAEILHEFTLSEAKEIWAETFADGGEAKKEKVVDEDDDLKDEDEDLEEVVTKKKKVVEEDEEEEAPARKRKVVDEDDDDDEEEETPVRKRREVVEEEEEKPVRTRRTRR